MSAPAGAATLLEAALDYARRGIPIVPLWPLVGDACSCQAGATCRTAGKHPRINGWQDRGSTTPETVRAWWTATPHAGIGGPTGKNSGVAVLDVDPRNGGRETLARLEATHGRLPRTPRLRSGSGGDHHHFAHPSDQRYAKLALGPGLELLLDGQQSVLPPSRNATGPYVWEVGLDDAELAPLPGWVVPLLEVRPPDQGGRARRRPAPPGTTPTRHRSGLPLGAEARAFFAVGARLRGAGADRTQRDALIAAVASAWGDTGLMLTAEAIKELAWQGISRSDVGDEGWPWTPEEVDGIVDDLLAREAPEPSPLEPIGTLLLNGKPLGVTRARAVAPTEEVHEPMSTPRRAVRRPVLAAEVGP